MRVTVVFPGAVDTNIAQNSGVTLTMEDWSGTIKMVAPTKAAQLVIDGMEKNCYRILVGSDAALMNFIYRTSPRRAARFIYQQMKALLPG